MNSRFYTQEQKEWLRENYPKLGSKETSRLLFELYGRKVNPTAIKKYCRNRLGCSVSKEVRYGGFTSPIGTVSENCRGEVKVKTEKGWIKATHSMVEVPKGMVAFNLDGNKYDNSPENIGITTNSKFRTLRNNGFWSNDRELTKTGLLWCDLNELLEGVEK